MYSTLVKQNHIQSQGSLQVEALLEQGTGLVNEDRLYVGGDVFAVVDGSTSLTEEYSSDVLSGGARAAELIVDSLGGASGSLLHRIDLANKAINDAMAGEQIDLSKKENRWAASVTAVRLHENSLEWCQIGDCRLVLVYDDGSCKVVGGTVDHDCKTLDLMRELGGRTKAMQTELMAHQILEVRRGMNVNYGVVNGEDNAVQFARTGIESLSQVTDILLFSDGLELGRQDKESVRHIVDLYKQGGLKNSRDYVRSQQDSDKAGIIYPRFKHHDDISAVALQLQ